MRTTYASLIFSIFVAGCGGGHSGLTVDGPPDMATAGPVAPPTFVAGNFTQLPGSTTDGWALVLDAAKTAWAIKLADGTQRKVADHVANLWPYYAVAFVQHDVGADGNGPLSVWRADGGLVRLADSSPGNSFGFSFPVADREGRIAYYRTGAGGNDLVVDDAAHSAPHVVLSGVELSQTSGACWPFLSFVSGRLLATHCDTGATTLTLTSYDPATGAGVDLQADSNLGFSWREGVGVLALSKSGKLSLVAADGSGAPRLIADRIGGTRWLADSTGVIAVTLDGALERLPLAAGATPTTLIPSGVVRLRGLSADNKFATLSKAVDSATGFGDLWLADATAPGTPTALVTTTTSSNFGYSFTEDSRFAIYLADTDAKTSVGSLRAFPTAGGTERILSAASDGATPMAGARVAFSSHPGGQWPNITADLGFSDLANSAAPTTVATGAYGFYDVEPDDKTIVWLDPGVGLHITVEP